MEESISIKIKGGLPDAKDHGKGKDLVYRNEEPTGSSVFTSNDRKTNQRKRFLRT